VVALAWSSGFDCGAGLGVPGGADAHACISTPGWAALPSCIVTFNIACTCPATCSAPHLLVPRAGGLGDVMQALPKSLAARGHRVMCIAPRYKNYDVRAYLLALGCCWGGGLVMLALRSPLLAWRSAKRLHACHPLLPHALA